MPEYIMIVAIAKNGVIGRDGKLPWHIPSDLKHFKKTTMGYPLLMGRKTFASIGKALPGRDNIVLTRNVSLSIPGCICVNSLESAMQQCAGYEKVFIIGGADIFTMTLPITDTIIVTQLERDVEGDIYFPPIDAEEFRITGSTAYQEEEPYSIVTYQRIV